MVEERTLEGEGCWRARRPESGEVIREEGEVTWEEEAKSNAVRRILLGYLYLPSVCASVTASATLAVQSGWHEVRIWEHLNRSREGTMEGVGGIRESDLTNEQKLVSSGLDVCRKKGGRNFEVV
jgi:hypothetical protein